MNRPQVWECGEPSEEGAPARADDGLATPGATRSVPPDVRVTMLVQGYPHLGGAERQIQALVPALARRGVGVDVIARRHPGQRRTAVVDGAVVRRVPMPPGRAARSLTYQLAAGAGALRGGRARRVVHAHGLRSPASAGLVARRFGLPLVVKVLRQDEMASLRRGGVVGRRRLGWLRRDVDAFIVISRTIDVELEQLGIPAARRAFIPNGVDTRRFRPAEGPQEVAALRRNLGLERDAMVAIYTGRLEPSKCLDDLLAVWASVVRAQPTARLVIVGDGSMAARLRHAAGDAVRFVGPVDDVAPWLRAADVFVSPSASEGLSNAALEACATGVPLVTTDAAGNVDIVGVEGAASLVRPGDRDGLRAELVRIMADDALRAYRGRRLRERAVRRYSLGATADALRRLYDDLALPESRRGR